MAQLIVALDFPRQAAALSLAQELQGLVPWCKVGMELFTLAGPALIETLKRLEYNVFLDLKFYDIPHTVAQAVKAAASLGIDMLTLHCQGGERMCREAAQAAADLAESKTLLFGVTVLTSFMPGEMPASLRRPPNMPWLWRVGRKIGGWTAWSAQGTKPERSRRRCRACNVFARASGRPEARREISVGL